MVTGAARRIGRALALGLAHEGATVIIHHGHSADEANNLQAEIASLGGHSYVIQADLAHLDEMQTLIAQATTWGPLYALVNNAAIFDALTVEDTDRKSWQQHLDINLTAPFLLSQAFARSLPAGADGRIVNILDWRALRPGSDHLPYTVSKAGLAALTLALAQALAPRITVNGIALGAILPPSDGNFNPRLAESTPAGRWGALDEVVETLHFLLNGPAYITGEIVHVDGGRHLV